MSHRGAKLVLLAASVAICAAAASSPLNAADAPKSTAKPAGLSADVEQLLKERWHVLQEIADVQRAAYKQGEVSFRSLLAAEEDVLSAKLELAKTPAERIEVLKGLVKIARELEKVTAQLLKTREATGVDCLRAKAHTLRAQADLTSERSAKGK